MRPTLRQWNGEARDGLSGRCRRTAQRIIAPLVVALKLDLKDYNSVLKFLDQLSQEVHFFGHSLIHAISGRRTQERPILVLQLKGHLRNIRARAFHDLLLPKETDYRKKVYLDCRNCVLRVLPK